MGKMKKGKAHHWYKEEKDKAPKKSYVPTGEKVDLAKCSFPKCFLRREAARPSKEGTRGGEAEVCAHGSSEGKEAGPEEQRIRAPSMPPCTINNQ